MEYSSNWVCLCQTKRSQPWEILGKIIINQIKLPQMKIYLRYLNSIKILGLKINGINICVNQDATKQFDWELTKRSFFLKGRGRRIINYYSDTNETKRTSIKIIKKLRD